MKCLILGDLHIGKSSSIGKQSELGKLNSRIQDQVDLLDWAYDLCNKDDELNHIFITGDVYQDYRPHPSVISIFMCWLKKCEKANISVIISMGNHDIIRSGQWVVSALDLVNNLELEKASVYKKITRIELDNFTIVLIPYIDKRMYELKDSEECLNRLSKELSDVCSEPSDKTKICIGHLAFEGSLSIGDEIVDQLNEMYVPANMFKWFDFVWMGHIHHPQVIQESNPYAAHIGSLDRSDFSKTEVDNNKIAILLDSNTESKFTEIVIPTRPLRPIKINVPSGKDSTDFVVNEICLLSKKLEFNNSIVKLEVILNGTELENVDRKKIESYLYNNLEVHNVCDFIESRSMSIISSINDEDSFDNTMNVSQAIYKWADTRDCFESKEESDNFILFANEVKNEYEEKLKK